MEETDTMNDVNVDQKKAEYVAEVKQCLGEIPAKSLEHVLNDGATRLKGCNDRQVELIKLIGEQKGWVLPKTL